MTKYDLMNDSTTYTDEFGNYFADILSYPINNFVESIPPLEIILTENDINRFDLFIYNVYSNLDYESFILWYNNIEYISRVEPGTKIILPSATDIEAWIQSYVK
jgi:hypothetical protein